MKYTIILFVSIFLFQSFNTLAQDKNVKELVSTLKQKVLLNDDQTNSIEKILTELLNKSKSVDDKNSLIQEAQKKVESFLDRKQLLKYDIIKNDWWKQVTALL